MDDKSYSNHFVAKASNAQPLENQTSTRQLNKNEIKVQWRDVIKLDIADPILKRHVEGFMDKLQNTAFKYETLDTQTGKKTLKELSGQEILMKLKDLQSAYNDPQVKDKLQQFLQDGKLVIRSHNTPFNGTPSTGCNTAFLTADGSLPVMINLGTDYLRGARVRNTDGSTSPVSVDAALANELAHMAFRTSNDNFSDQIENIIVVALGGKQRIPSTQAQIEFQRGSNFSYQTLFDKTPATKSSVKTSEFSMETAPIV